MHRTTFTSALLVSLIVAIPAAGQPAKTPQPKPAKAQPSQPTANGGVQAAKPALGAEVMAAISEAARQTALPPWVPASERATVNRIIGLLKAGRRTEAFDVWRGFVAKTKAVPARDSRQRGTVARWIVREAYLTPNPKVATAADKLRFAEEKQAAITEQINRLRSALGSAKGRTPVTVRLFTIRTEYSPGQPAAAVEAETKLTREALAAQIKSAENQLEETKNKRQEYQTMFENFDQKTNQLFNLLSTVLKTTKEMESSVVRNMN